MNADQRLLVVGLYINSALYLAGCMAFGYLTGHSISWKFALASAGVSYIAYYSQIIGADFIITRIAVVISIAAGLTAGVSLLW